MDIANSCASIGLSAFAATVFYKRRFDWCELPIVTYSLLQAALLQCDNTSLRILASLALMYSGYVNRQQVLKVLDNTIVAKPSMFVAMVLLVADVRHGAVVSCAHWFGVSPLLLTSHRWMCLRAGVSSVIQFLRYPRELKDSLQAVRSHLGPVFVASVAHFAWTLSTTSHATTLQIACYTAAACALTAGTVFRPDNNVLSSALTLNMTNTDRKTHHRNLMITAFVLTLATQAYAVYCDV